MYKAEMEIMCTCHSTGTEPNGSEDLETTVYECVDPEHDAWKCQKCGHIEDFEADGPEENGWSFCPGCGRMIELETRNETEDQ